MASPTPAHFEGPGKVCRIYCKGGKTVSFYTSRCSILDRDFDLGYYTDPLTTFEACIQPAYNHITGVIAPSTIIPVIYDGEGSAKFFVRVLDYLSEHGDVVLQSFIETKRDLLMLQAGVIIRQTDPKLR
jgi:hypothetical protein